MAKQALVLIGLLAIGNPMAEAQVTAVQVNMITGTPDTNFVGGVLTVSEFTLLDVVTVNEASALAGFTNMTLDLTTTLNTVFLDPDDLKIKAQFLGGSISLTFDDGGSSYELSGPIVGMEVQVNSSGPGFTQLSGEGIFEALVANLPANPTGVWDPVVYWGNPMGWSFMRGFIWNIGEDLGTDFGWDRDWIGDAESQWQFDPGAPPEPTTLALLALGGMVVVRRRGPKS